MVNSDQSVDNFNSPAPAIKIKQGDKGIIVTNQTQIFKWKIGAEVNHSNKIGLEKMIPKTEG